MHHDKGAKSHSPLDPKILSAIDFDSISTALFSDLPEEIAKHLARNQKSNKPAQIRKFFNEIVMWDEKSTALTDEEFKENILPFLKMLKAKAAYAHGRNNIKNEPQKGLVDRDFLNLTSHCLDQVKDIRTLHHFKHFMEAFMGFYKLARPKD